MLSASFFKTNLGLRVLTAVIGGPLVILLVLLSWWTTALLMLVLIGMAVYEYQKLVHHKPSSERNNLLFGLIYFGIPFVAALWLRGQEDGEGWFLMALAGNWLADIAAYLVGRYAGRTPFAPKISPKKTWEGVTGGLIFGFLATILVAKLFNFPINAPVTLTAIFVPIATVLGDLLESKIKRHFEVKDSGSILPGHGGILDRIDGTLLALPTTALIVLLAQIF